MFGSKPEKQSQPELTPEQIAGFTEKVSQFIRAQRAHYYPRAVPLTFSEIWSRFFSPIDLQRVRVLQPGQERVPNPSFYAELKKLGFTRLPDFTSMSAVAFNDVVVFRDPLTPQLIFHEMVHCVQYRLLGVDDFARLYVRGYLHGGYEGTPLEVCAYELDGRFIMGSVGFDVEAEVRSWIENGRL